MRNIRKENSRNKLKALTKKRIQTTMIGALASIEKFFGHLWGQNKDEKDLSPQEKELDDLYEELRKEILDKGNNQIRLLNGELDNYDVELLMHEFILRK